MRTLVQGSFYGIVILALFLALFYAFKFENKPLVLNVLARLYFDKTYYLKTYPEVAQAGVDPFEHYMSVGWREGKNPRADFDEHFYRNFQFKGGESRSGLNAIQYHMRALLHFRKEPTYVGDMKKATPLKNPKYYLTLIAIFRDEAPYLKEWIEFYRLQGVEHFYLHNHLSKDNYKEVLAPYIKEGIVELLDVTGEPKTKEKWDSFQEDLYNDVIKRIAQDVEWVVVVDTDEFLYPLKADRLSEALKAYDDLACLSVPWQMFGSGQVERHRPDKLLIEELTMANPNKDSCIKSIMKPRYVKRLGTVHFPRLQPGFAQANERRQYFEGFKHPQTNQEPEIFKLNHYWARDWAFFKERKLSRIHIVGKDLSGGELQKKVQEQVDRNNGYSLEKQTDILRFVPALRKRMQLS